MGAKDGTYLGMRGTVLQMSIGLLAGLDFLLFGYDQGVTGGLLTLKSFNYYFPEIDMSAEATKNLTAAQTRSRSAAQGITVAAYNLGCLSGAIPTIWIGNYLGRRKTIFVGSSVMIIGAILQCTSFSLPQLIVGRIVTGFGNGLNTSTVPTWQSECCKANRRGQMVMMEGAMITLGITVSYWVDFGLLFTDPSSVSWRFPLAFQIFFALIIVCLVLFLPESPRWLIFKGRDEEAKLCLSALLAEDVDSDYIRLEYKEIKATVLEMSKGSFRDLFTMGEDRHFHRVVLAYVNQMFQQISGINLVTYYIPDIVQNSLGMSPVKARIIAACNGTEYFLASWIAVFTVEHFGRRTLMLFGSVGMGISMIILTITKSLETTAGNIATIVFFFVFNSCFAVGWLGMTWLYPAEITPLKIRAPANAVSTSANWTFNFLVVMITPVCFNLLGYKTYIIWAVINLVYITPVTYFFFPETTNRSLEEMDSIWRKTTNIFDCVKIAREEPHMYGKNGELLRDINDLEQEVARRVSAVDHEYHDKDKRDSDGSPIEK